MKMPVVYQNINHFKTKKGEILTSDGMTIGSFEELYNVVQILKDEKENEANRVSFGILVKPVITNPMYFLHFEDNEIILKEQTYGEKVYLNKKDLKDYINRKTDNIAFHSKKEDK